jgi:hypothetical protein
MDSGVPAVRHGDGWAYCRWRRMPTARLPCKQGKTSDLWFDQFLAWMRMRGLLR